LGVSNLPLSLFLTEKFPISYLRLLLLLAFFIMFLMRLKQEINWKVITVISFVPLVFVLIFRKPEANPSNIYLEKTPILMHDLEVYKKGLRSYYWDSAGGGNITLINFPYKKAEQLSLKNNQVFYRNRQLTFDKSNKQTPILIDNRTVFYLSDFDRGIGFYTLRKIELRGK
jgi:hypothetical protein